nr:4'-phosphopantetheinyl transferase superfamily protein [Motilibacter deserti]
MVACVVARGRDCGIDAEWAGRRLDPELLARGGLAPEERAGIAALPAQRRAFAALRYWTLREAVLKATGDGLSVPAGRLAFALDGAGPRLLERPGAPWRPGEWALVQRTRGEHVVSLAVRVQDPAAPARGTSAGTLRLAWHDTPPGTGSAVRGNEWAIIPV